MPKEQRREKSRERFAESFVSLGTLTYLSRGYCSMFYNKVILIGNVGRDPDVKYFDNQNLVANFSLATTEGGYTKANGDYVPEQTDWHSISCFRETARFVEKHVYRGKRVVVEGRLRNRQYTNRLGEQRNIVEVVADRVTLLGGGSREGRRAKEERPSAELDPLKRREEAFIPPYDKYSQALDDEVDDTLF